MTDKQDRINLLMLKMDLLLKRQDVFAKEIQALQVEIDKIKNEAQTAVEEPTVEVQQEASIPDYVAVNDKQEAEIPTVYPIEETKQEPSSNWSSSKKIPSFQADLEKFIGENLINKIGIAITVIGVAIGAKYSIEHNLISPLTRIILGYLFGLGLLGFGIKLKEKYENYSAVLVSGAMAIMYFMTFSAYSFYGLLPQVVAFALMVVFTAFTVMAALHYNKQVIAHIGLVGAYAVPFLLSDGSGRVAVLFTYMAILNGGILAIAFKKYWKPLYYVAFVLSWLIYFAWFVNDYQTKLHFGVGLFFLTVFFITFYLTFLAYKLLRKEKFETQDIVLLLANSFIFYTIGYNLLDIHPTGTQLLGLFTLANALVHFIVSFIIYRQQLADRNLFYLVSGLVLVFITIAIPVQLDGNWVTLLWVGEAALLFWLGRTKAIWAYEKLAYPLLILAFFSLLHDWATVYDNYVTTQPESRLLPLLNVNFLSSVLFIAAFGYVYYLNNKTKEQANEASQRGIYKFFSYCIPAILGITVFFAFRMEIANYWDQLFTDSYLQIKMEARDYTTSEWNYDLLDFKTVWLYNYALLFFSLLAQLNMKRLKNKLLGKINLVLLVLTLLTFLTFGLYALSELRDSYLAQYLEQYYQKGPFYIGIRYVSFAFVAFALYNLYQYTKQVFLELNLKIVFDFVLHTTVLWILSSELISWMDIAKAAQSYKLGLSILWGVYALFLIAMGIWKKKKYMRIGAIALFGLTLVKLFFYDISHLDTIAKTIVFVSLGVLLLIISFLYNKYKNIISDDTTN